MGEWTYFFWNSFNVALWQSRHGFASNPLLTDGSDAQVANTAAMNITERNLNTFFIVKYFFIFYYLVSSCLMSTENKLIA